jgi:hypothetical protein
VFALAAALLSSEAVLNGLWLAGKAGRLAMYDPIVWVMLASRGAVTVLQLSAAVMLSRNAPAAVSFARAGWLLSALLVTLEHGARLSPSSLFPVYRWPVVAVYWCYALVLVALLQQAGRRLR